MDSLIVENVRCFRERQEVPLRPLTFLVGENSTGKSTFLALIRCAWQLSCGPVTPDFNSEPFLLGAYEQIAHLRGGGRSSTSFMIGGTLSATSLGMRARGPAAVVGTFSERSAQPFLLDWGIGIGEASLSMYTGMVPARARIRTSSGVTGLRLKHYDRAATLGNLPPEVLRLLYTDSKEVPKRSSILHPMELRQLRALVTALTSPGRDPPIASAPIRSRPKRTYDPVRDLPEPEGEHTPMILANIHDSAPNYWRSLLAELKAFGKASGLLEGIEIKRKGKKRSDPFQVNVTVGGSRVNLMDVGYGVSQILPILVDGLSSRRGAQFLLQQPEVHLHPKAQAQLGTLLGQLVSRQLKRFVVETHSDYLIDRVRMEVRDGRIANDDVLILYFQRRAGKVVIHSIRVDRSGDLVGAPSDYRRFFLREQRRFISG